MHDVTGGSDPDKRYKSIAYEVRPGWSGVYARVPESGGPRRVRVPRGITLEVEEPAVRAGGESGGSDGAP